MAVVCGAFIIGKLHVHIEALLLIVCSVVDQQVKQTVRFAGGRLVGNFDGQVYVATTSSIHCLFPQPWHRQVQVSITYPSLT